MRTDTASTSRLGAVLRCRGKVGIAAPLAIAIGLLTAPAFADTYTYSPERPYPPADRAATEYMKQGYMTGAADSEGYYWARGTGEADVPEAYDPLWMFAPLRSLATQLGLTD